MYRGEKREVGRRRDLAKCVNFATTEQEGRQHAHRSRGATFPQHGTSLTVAGGSVSTARSIAHRSRDNVSTVLRRAQAVPRLPMKNIIRKLI